MGDQVARHAHRTKIDSTADKLVHSDLPGVVIDFR